MLVGAHVKQEDPLEGALAREATIAQLFLGKPQEWKAPTLGYPEGPEALKVAAESVGLPLIVHAPYVINVATLNNRVRIPSRKILQQQIDLAAQIGAAGIVVHGGHVGDEADLEAGFANWAKCIERTDAKVPILIENTAGGAGAMARGVERIERLFAAIREVPGGENVGFTLDTCHAWASGEPLPGLAERVRAVTGRIDLVHGNDSRDEFASGADRHINFGHGNIPEADLVALFTEAQAPIVIETHGGVPAEAADIKWIRARVPGAS